MSFSYQIQSQYIVRHWIYPIVLTATLLLIVMMGVFWMIEYSLESAPDGGEEAGYFIFFSILFGAIIVTPLFVGTILGYQQGARYEIPFSIILGYAAPFVIYSLYDGASVLELMSFVMAGPTMVVLIFISVLSGVGAVIGSLSSTGIYQFSSWVFTENEERQDGQG